MPTSVELGVADACWVALALLHRAEPARDGFSPSEILAKLDSEFGGLRPGHQTHISAHNVANADPNPGRYRLFYRLDRGKYRLYRPGDPAHPKRTGKTKPDRREVPAEYQPLLDWYEREYVITATVEAPVSEQELYANDPLLKLAGSGKHLWADEAGDEFLRREREGWDIPERSRD